MLAQHDDVEVVAFCDIIKEQAMRAMALADSNRHVEAVTQDVRFLAIADGKQAVHLVRRRAAEWGIDPRRIGILGFSAGGSVAAGVARYYEAGSRPDFAGVIYGALFGEVAAPADTPPLFIALATDDALAVEPSLDL